MQGRKELTPQLFYDLSLNQLVPLDNYYRIIQHELSFDLYQATSKYYGKEGQKSIDPVVFFKLLNES